MGKIPFATVLLAMAMSVPASAQDAKSVVAEASKAMGSSDLSSITYSGVAAQGNFGQSKTISFRLASTSIRNYTRTIDFTRPASRATGVTFPPDVPGSTAPQPGTFNQVISPDTPAWSQQM